jgi:hypothetical protein
MLLLTKVRNSRFYQPQRDIANIYFALSCIGLFDASCSVVEASMWFELAASRGHRVALQVRLTPDISPDSHIVLLFSA